MTGERLSARRAIEALRAGVPGLAAVKELGTTQTAIEETFRDRLWKVAEGQGAPVLVLEADFGGGKSHLLRYLQSIAADDGFVTSFAVLGPELPLGNAQVVLKALAASSEAPGREGRALRALASGFRTDGPQFAGLRAWARDADINDRFKALLHLYEEQRDEHFRLQAIGDFEGTPTNRTEIARRLKEIGQLSAYALKGAPRNAMLAHDRLRVLAHFYQACTGKGWVIFFDEFERLAQFTARQQISALHELGWWGQQCLTSALPVVFVLTAATGHLEQVIQDLQNRLSVGSDSDTQAAGAALALLRESVALKPADDAELAGIQFKVKGIYERAYGCQVAATPATRREAGRTIRNEIRRWITQWDLRRYDPTYRSHVTADEVPMDDRVIAEDVMEGDGDGGAQE